MKKRLRLIDRDECTDVYIYKYICVCACVRVCMWVCACVFGLVLWHINYYRLLMTNPFYTYKQFYFKQFSTQFQS